MNNFDDIPFEQNDTFSSEQNDSMDAIPFEEVPSEDKVPTMVDDNNIIVLDERIKDIKPEEKISEPTLDANNILKAKIDLLNSISNNIGQNISNIYPNIIKK